MELFPSGAVRRLNVNLPIEEHEELREIARSTGQSMTDCVRAALRLLARAVEEESQGNTLAFVSETGVLVQEVRVSPLTQRGSLRVKTGTRAGVVVPLRRHR